MSAVIINHKFEAIIASQQPLPGSKKIAEINSANEFSMAKIALPAINLINKIQQNKIHSTHNVKQQLLKQLNKYETTLAKLDYSPTAIYSSRLFICAWLDQAISCSKLSPAHILGSTTIAKTIQIDENLHLIANYILEKAVATPQSNQQLLELAYICLTMGYTNLTRYSNNLSAAEYQTKIYQILQYHSNKKKLTNNKPLTKTNNQGLLVFVIFIGSITLVTYSNIFQYAPVNL